MSYSNIDDNISKDTTRTIFTKNPYNAKSLISFQNWIMEDKILLKINSTLHTLQESEHLN